MRMHFNLLVKKISSKITLSGLVKLLASTCAYYKICENKDDLIDLIFVHMIHFFCYNQQAIDQVINLIEQVWTGKNRQSRRKIQKHRELETQNLGDVQYVYFIYLAKSGKLNTNFSISLSLSVEGNNNTNMLSMARRHFEL